MNKSDRIPIGQPIIDQSDRDLVADVLNTTWLTKGPRLEEFESAICSTTNSKYAIAVNSGTAALHAAIAALNIGRGDEVIVPSITFLATVNAVVYLGATPCFADVEASTLLLDPDSVVEQITPRTRAIITVDYAGHPSRYDELHAIADSNNLALIADACHALGAKYHGEPVGSLADVTTFSFHPVKAITTGEGGMIVTNSEKTAEFVRAFRNHGIHKLKESESDGPWHYSMNTLGYNYRMSELNAALGLSQIKKLDAFIESRSNIARQYDTAFADWPFVKPLIQANDIKHAHHIYVVRINFRTARITRKELFFHMAQLGVELQVHYVPVHTQPYFRNRYGIPMDKCPVANSAYDQIVSLPIYATMTNSQVERVIDGLGQWIPRA